ncbi:bifunctional nicotinamide mononucleotide adenylyltransferase/ADP-ribose pyrophosphatase [Serratia rubidaea]|uniref:Bifunctional nicotinamide mononucleotide adenylyltransferase/ADP-ribose pyrophosphatase n=1 Tax=Serratia rubidaea TaxID=61652 RepID=A0A447QKK0_SERRU|nr:bifunctional nicotinamide mononucleotide adenylyltransferase/ADP-ribose pyrophosphatase [Serratia rubidaea]
MSTETDYLQNYDASRFPAPIVTVDSVLFTVHQEQLCVLMVKRANHPFQGRWGLPGGFIDLQRDDSTGATAQRKLMEKTGIARRIWRSWRVFPAVNATRAAGA